MMNLNNAEEREAVWRIMNINSFCSSPLATQKALIEDIQSDQFVDYMSGTVNDAIVARITGKSHSCATGCCSWSYPTQGWHHVREYTGEPVVSYVVRQQRGGA